MSNDEKVATSLGEKMLEALKSLNDNMVEVKAALATQGKAEAAPKGKAAKATDDEWARRLAANAAAGRTMETARFYCDGKDCSYACYNEPKIDAHVAKRGGDHAKKSV